VLGVGVLSVELDGVPELVTFDDAAFGKEPIASGFNIC
jgi:hypothetical protein